MKPMRYISIIFLSMIFANTLDEALNNSDIIEISIIEQNTNYVIINYKINTYSINDFEYNNEIFQSVSIEGEPNFLIQNGPSLPHINRSLIIPDNFSSSITVLESNYIQMDDINVIPSKGNITRNFDINSFPYIKGEIYNENEFFPESIAELHDPYILRDYRGQVLQVNPFLINPVTKTLKIYTDITLRIDFNGLNAINTYTNRNESKKLVYDFDNLYKDHFLNYGTYQSRYTPLLEDGEMLVICYDSFCDETQEFVDWKN